MEYLSICLCCLWFLSLMTYNFLCTVLLFPSVQFSRSVVSDPLRPHEPQHASLPLHHQLLEFTQTNLHWVSDAIQPSHHLSSPSPPALNLSQHQGLFQWVSSSHQVAKVLEFQLQHQFFQWTTRTDLYFNLKQIDSFHHLDKHLTFSWDNEYMCFTNNTMS